MLFYAEHCRGHRSFPPEKITFVGYNLLTQLYNSVPGNVVKFADGYHPLNISDGALFINTLQEQYFTAYLHDVHRDIADPAYSWQGVPHRYNVIHIIDKPDVRTIQVNTRRREAAGGSWGIWKIDHKKNYAGIPGQSGIAADKPMPLHHSTLSLCRFYPASGL